MASVGAKSMVKPLLGEHGSDFHVQDDNELQIHHVYTEDAQLLNYWDRSDTILAPGSTRLITANMRNLSEFLVLNGVTVKAWSFFSGDLPDAEMILRTRDELDAIFELAQTLSFEDLSPEREAYLEENGFRDDEFIAPFQTVLEAGFHEAYLVDDWSRLEREFKSRESAGLLKHSFATLSDLLAINQVSLFAGLPNSDGNAYYRQFQAYRAHKATLDEFDGKRVSRGTRW
jgi:hypothetical protein